MSVSKIRVTQPFFQLFGINPYYKDLLCIKEDLLILL